MRRLVVTEETFNISSQSNEKKYLEASSHCKSSRLLMRVTGAKPGPSPMSIGNYHWPKLSERRTMANFLMWTLN